MTDDLEQLLVDLSRNVRFPDTPDLTSDVSAQLRRWPRRLVGPPPSAFGRRLAGALLAASLIVGAILAVSPGARAAVAGWFGIPGIRIIVEGTLPTPGPLGRSLALGKPVTLDDARRRLAFPILMPALAGFGAPDEVYIDTRPPGGRVTLLYRARPGLPRTPQTGAGLLLTEFHGRIDRPFMAKMVTIDKQVRPVDVGTDAGYWIQSTHLVIVYHDDRRKIFADTVRLAGSALVWRHGDLALRIESTLSRQKAVRVAMSVRS